MSKEFKTHILKYTVEMLIVAFGVMLGIYVSEWKSMNKVNENTAQALDNILQEIEANSKNLISVISYHEEIRDNLQPFVMKINKVSINEPYFENHDFHFTKIPNWTGVKLPKFETIAFESAKMTGVLSHIDIEQVQVIANAYKQISFNQDFGKALFEKMIGMDSSTKVIDAIGMIELLTTDVLGSERALQYELDLISKEVRVYQKEHYKKQS